MRETWDIPLNSIEEIQNGEYRMTWCEKYQGPGDYEQVAAINNKCPDGLPDCNLLKPLKIKWRIWRSIMPIAYGVA